MNKAQVKESWGLGRMVDGRNYGTKWRHSLGPPPRGGFPEPDCRQLDDDTGLDSGCVIVYLVMADSVCGRQREGNRRGPGDGGRNYRE